MSRLIKVCVDRVLPPEVQVYAAQRAIEENPANARAMRDLPGLGVAPSPPVRMAIIAGKKWLPGREIRVHFLDGHPDVQAKVASYAQQWCQHANLKLKFGYDPSAEIRISFEHEGSWSYLGTDALSVDRPEPTMNFGWLTPSSSEDEYQRVVLHEFGHGLGCIHEHQHPEAGIPWNKEAVYRYYMGAPNYWTKPDVDNNLFAKYDSTVTNFSQYDPHSIMHYPIPKELTDGVFEVGWNRELSDTDKSFIGTEYPGQKPEHPRLEVNGPAVEASIGAHGEEDLFEFAVTEQGHYRIETEGHTDVVMVLLGPDSPSTALAEDDDSGRAYNAKISIDLSPGTYYARIRHYRPTGTGTYKISVRRE